MRLLRCAKHRPQHRIRGRSPPPDESVGYSAPSPLISASNDCDAAPPQCQGPQPYGPEGLFRTANGKV